MRMVLVTKLALLFVVLSSVFGCGQVHPEHAADQAAPAPVANQQQPLKGEAADAKRAMTAVVESKIIRIGYVSLTVEELDPLQDGVRQLAKRFDAQIADSDLQAQTQSRRRCTWTIRVPSEKYEELLSEVSRLGPLQSVRSTAQDVSDECIDIAARIRNKQVEVDRLLKLFESASATLNQVGEVQRELSRAQEELERLQGRQRWLELHTSYSTIHLSVDEISPYVPPTKLEPTPFQEQISATWNSSWLALIEAIRYGTLFVIALAPWLGLISIFVLPMRLRRNRKQRNAPSTSA